MTVKKTILGTEKNPSTPLRAVAAVTTAVKKVQDTTVSTKDTVHQFWKNITDSEHARFGIMAALCMIAWGIFAFHMTTIVNPKQFFQHILVLVAAYGYISILVLLIVLAVALLVFEGKGMWNSLHVDEERLDLVEYTHPYMPKKRHILVALLLGLSLPFFIWSVSAQASALNAALKPQLTYSYTENRAWQIANDVGDKSITGTVYSNTGGTVPLTGVKVSVSLNGAAVSGTGTVDAGGQYTITGQTITGGTIVGLYISGASGGGGTPNKGMTVSYGSGDSINGASMTGMTLIRNNLIIKSGSGFNVSSPVTNTVLRTAINRNYADMSAIYTKPTTPPNLTVAANKILRVWTGSTFLLDAQLTSVPRLHINGNMIQGANKMFVTNLTQSGGTFTGGTETISAANVFSQKGGTFVSTNSGFIVCASNTLCTFVRTSGTFTHNNGTVIHNPGTILGTWTTNNATFYNLRLTTSDTGSRTTTFTDNFTVENDLNVQKTSTTGTRTYSATVASPSTITLQGSFTMNSANVNGAVFGSQYLTVTMTANNPVFLASGRSTFNGNLNMNGTGTATLSATGATTTGTVVLNQNTKLGTGAKLYSLTISNGYTLDASPDGGSTIYDIQVKKDFYNHGTYTARTNTTNFAPLESKAQVISAPSTTFYNLALTSLDNGANTTSTLSGSFTVSNNMTVAKSAGALNRAWTSTATYPTTITLQGNFTMSDNSTGAGRNIFGNNNVTVNMTANNPILTVTAGRFEANVNMNGTGTATLSATGTTTTGTIVLNQNTVLGAHAKVQSLTISNGYTLDASPDGGSTVYDLKVRKHFTNKGGTYTARTNTTTFNPVSAVVQTISAPNTTFYNLTFDSIDTSAGTATLSGSFTVSNTLTVFKWVGSSTRSWTSTATYPTTITLQGNFNMYQQTTGLGIITFGNKYTTINMTGADKTFAVSHGTFNGDVNMNGTGTATLSATGSTTTGTIVLNQNTVLGAGTTLQSLTISNGYTLDASPDGGANVYDLVFARHFINYGTYVPRTNTTWSIPPVSFDPQRIESPNTTFYNLKILEAGNQSNNRTNFSGSFTVNNNFSMQKTGGNTVRVYGASAPSTLNIFGSITLTKNTTTMSFGNSLLRVILKGSANQVLTSSGVTTFACSGTTIAKTGGMVTLAGPTAWNFTRGNINMTGGTLNLDGKNLTVSKSLIIGTGTTLRLHGDETLSYTTILGQRNSTFWYDSPSASTVTMGNYPYQNVVIGSTGSTVFRLPTGQLNLSGSLTISGGTLATTNAQRINLSGSWLKTTAANAIFTAGTGTVLLSGRDQTLSGSTTFYNLTKSVTAARTLTFAATTTQTVTNTLTLNGTLGNLLSLRSSQTGTKWKIDPSGSRSIQYVDVKDSNNIHGTAISCTTGCTNSLNNTNWTFSTASTSITGKVYSDTGGTVPISGVTVGVSLNGGAVSGTDATDTGGEYTITAQNFTGGTVVALYISGSASHNAVTVSNGSGTSTVGANMTGMTLIKNNLIIKYGSGFNVSSPVTATILNTADNADISDINAIFYADSTGIVANTGKRIFIWSGSTLDLNSAVDLNSDFLHVNGNLIVTDPGNGIVVTTFTQSGGTMNATDTPAMTATTFSQKGGTFLAPATTLQIYGDFTRTNNATFTHNSGLVDVVQTGNSAFTITTAGATFYDVQLNHNATAVSTTTLADSFTVTHSLTLPANLSPTATRGWSATSPITITLQGDYSALQAKSGFGDNVTLLMTGTNSQSFSPSKGTFSGSVVINKTAGVVTAGTGLLLRGTAQDLILSGGTLNLDGNRLTTGRNFVVGTGTTLRLDGNQTISVSGRRFAHRNSTTWYDKAGTTVTLPAVPYQNVVIGSSGSAIYKLPVGQLNLSGSLTISGGTLNVNGGQVLNLSGSWLKTTAATFTAGTGTVLLSGSDQTMSGSNTFNKLTKTVTGSKSQTLTFAATTTQSITTLLTLQGTSTNNLNLRSSQTGTQWIINASGVRTMNYLDVKDSNNTSSPMALTVSSGNNTNWGIGKTIVGTVYSNTGGTVPLTGVSVAVSINGGVVAGTGAVDNGGQYTISNLSLTGGSVIGLYIAGSTTNKAVTVSYGSGTSSVGANMTGMTLIKNNLIVKYGSGFNISSPVTSSMLRIAKNRGYGDMTAIYTNSSDDITIATGKKLYVWTGSTLQLGGTLTATYAHINGNMTQGAHKMILTNLTQSGGTFTGGSQTINVSTTFSQRAGTFTSTSSGFLMSGTATSTFLTAGTFTHNSGTVSFTPATAIAQTIITPSTIFYNLTFNSVDSTATTTTLSGSMTVANALTVNKTSGTNTRTYSATTANRASINLQGAMTLVKVGGTTGGVTFGNPNVKVMFTGSANQTLTQSGGTFAASGTTIGKSAGIVTLSGASLNFTKGNLNLTGGTLNINGRNLTVSKTLIVGTGTTMRWRGTETLTYTTILGQSKSTIWYDSPSASTVALPNLPYQNVIIGSTGSTVFRLPTGQLNLSGSLTISGGTLATTNAQRVNLSGSWLKTTAANAIFTAGTGTVLLSGRDQTLSGSTTFYNLTKSVTAARTLTFAATTTQTVTNALTLNGASSNQLSLRSSQTGTQWKINPSGSRSIQYVDVKDSNNTNATAIDCTVGCTDSLNNTNWTLTNTAIYSITGKFYRDAAMTIPEGPSAAIRLRINGSDTANTTTTDAGGQFTFSNMSITGGTIMSFVGDALTSGAANTITMGTGGTTGANMTGVILVKNNVILKYGSGFNVSSPLTNRVLRIAVGSMSDPNQILAAGTADAMSTSSAKVWLWSGTTLNLTDTFSPASLLINGTMTQGANKITVTAGLSQSGGTFTGGSETIYLSGVTGKAADLTLKGGTFVSTSSGLVLGNVATTGNNTVTIANTFSHNNGTVITKLLSTTYTQTFVAPNGLTLYNYTMSGGNVNAVAGTISVANALALNKGSLLYGRVNVQGTMTHKATFSLGYGTLYISSNNQSISLGASGMPGMVLNAAATTVTLPASGTVTFGSGVDLMSGTITGSTGDLTFDNESGVTWGPKFSMEGGTFTAPSGTTTLDTRGAVPIQINITGGTFNHNNGSFLLKPFNTSTSTMNLSANPVFYDMYFNDSGFINIATGQKLTTQHLFDVGSSGGFYGGTIDARGDIKLHNANNYSTSALQLSGTGTQQYWSGNGSFTSGNWTIAKPAGMVTLSGALTLGTANQSLNMTGGILNLNGNALSVTGNLTQGTGTTLRMDGDETITVTGSRFAHRNAVTWYDKAGGTVTLPNAPYQNVVIGSTGSTVFNLPTGQLNLSGSLTISGGTLTVNSAQRITLSGSWLKTSAVNAGFSAGAGTVVLSGKDQTMSGSTTFYNLTKSVTAARTLTFAATTTQTVTNTLTLNGLTANLLSLRSSQMGTQWKIDPSGTRSVEYVDVKDSNNLNSTSIDCLTGCVNSSNNVRWGFPNTGTMKGLLWSDSDGDGTKDGDEITGLSGVSVALTGNTGTGMTLNRSTTTASTGQFFFSGTLVSSSAGYTVTVNSNTAPTGYLRTRFNSSGSNVLGTGGLININFGYVRVNTLSGSVFLEANSNGIKDEGETAFSGSTVTLTGTSGTGGTVSQTTRSNASGTYLFSNLPTANGNFIVAAEPPSGYTTTTSNSRSVSFGTGGQIKHEYFGYTLTSTESSSSSSTATSTESTSNDIEQTPGARRGRPIVATAEPIVERTDGSNSSTGQKSVIPTIERLTLPKAPAVKQVEAVIEKEAKTQDLAKKISIRFGTAVDYAAIPASNAAKYLGNAMSAAGRGAKIVADTFVSVGRGVNTFIDTASGETRAIALRTVESVSGFAGRTATSIGTAVAYVGNGTQQIFNTTVDNTRSVIAGVTGGVRDAGSLAFLQISRLGNGTLQIIGNTSDAVIRTGDIALLRMQELGAVGKVASNSVRAVASFTANVGTGIGRTARDTVTLVATTTSSAVKNVGSAALQTIRAGSSIVATTGTGLKNASDSLQSQIIRTTLGGGQIALRALDTQSTVARTGNRAEDTVTNAIALVGRNVSDTPALVALQVKSAAGVAGGVAQNGMEWTGLQIARAIIETQTIAGNIASDTSNVVTTIASRFTSTQTPQIATQTIPPPLKYKTSMRKLNGQVLIASLSMSVLDSIGNPFANTPVVLFSTPKVAVTNTDGIATFHDVETGKHQIEIHVKDGTIQKRDFIIEPPATMSLDEQKQLDVALPLIQLVVADSSRQTSGMVIPVYGWIIIGLLALSNIGWAMMIWSNRRKNPTERIYTVNTKV